MSLAIWIFTNLTSILFLVLVPCLHCASVLVLDFEDVFVEGYNHFLDFQYGDIHSAQGSAQSQSQTQLVSLSQRSQRLYPLGKDSIARYSTCSSIPSLQRHNLFAQDQIHYGIFYGTMEMHGMQAATETQCNALRHLQAALALAIDRTYIHGTKSLRRSQPDVAQPSTWQDPSSWQQWNHGVQA